MEHTFDVNRLFDRRHREPKTANSGAEVPANVIPVSTDRLVALTAVIAGCLLILSFVADSVAVSSGIDHGIWTKFSKAVSVDRESNISAFFSMLLLLVASVLLAGIALLTRTQQRAGHLYWTVLSAGFLFMAFDEIAEVHERMVEPIRGILGGGELGILYYAWVIPGIVIAVLCGAVFFRFWWKLPPRVRTFIFIAAVLYLGGALGMEFLGGSHAEGFGTRTLTYVILTTVEEAMEMAGSILFIKILLEYLEAIAGDEMTIRLAR